MLRRVSSLGLPGTVFVPALVAALALAPACGTRTDTVQIAVNPSLVLPRGVLDKVVKLRLTVLEGSVTCDTTIGQTMLPNGTDAAKQIAQRDLGTTSCVAPAKFCGDLDIEKSEAPRVFSAEAEGDGDTTLAIGCASIVVNSDAVPVPIKMFRFIAPSVCGDMVIQPTEQCEPTSTNSATCDSTCATKELLLSTGSTQTGTSTGTVGDKSDPFFLWPSTSGKSGRFFAFFTDRAVSGSNNFEVSLRGLTDDLSPIGAAEFPALAAGSIFLPNDKAIFPPDPAPRRQQTPQAASLNGKFYVVFEDDTGTGATGIDIHLRSMNEALEAEQTAIPLGINGGAAGTGGGSGAGEAAVQQVPAIAAGPMGRLFIAWEDLRDGSIQGRTLTPPSTVGDQRVLSTGNANSGVSLAATPTGWVAVWQSGAGVKLRVLNQDGLPQGSDQTVNENGSVVQRPRVASLPDGRFAVIWASSGDIFVQRYDAKGSKIAGDQSVAINDVVKDGEQNTPSIAGATAVGGSYVAVWLDAASSNVQGRMLGGSAGFLFNNVNGQSTEFQASRAAGRERANPVVASGGSGPFVAIGWEDKTSPGPGIIARRFPLPSE